MTEQLTSPPCRIRTESGGRNHTLIKTAKLCISLDCLSLFEDRALLSTLKKILEDTGPLICPSSKCTLFFIITYLLGYWGWPNHTHTHTNPCGYKVTVAVCLVSYISAPRLHFRKIAKWNKSIVSSSSTEASFSSREDVQTNHSPYLAFRRKARLCDLAVAFLPGIPPMGTFMRL